MKYRLPTQPLQSISAVSPDSDDQLCTIQEEIKAALSPENLLSQSQPEATNNYNLSENLQLQFSLFLCNYLKSNAAHSLSSTTHCIYLEIKGWQFENITVFLHHQKADTVKKLWFDSTAAATSTERIISRLPSCRHSLVCPFQLVGRTGCLRCHSDISSNQVGHISGWQCFLWEI